MTKLFQIWISSNDKLPVENIQNTMSKLKAMYSECDYKLYTDTDIKLFLETNFSNDVLQAYNMVKSYAFKSDLARYCLLYKNGGYYFDVSICPEFKLEHNYDAFCLKGQSLEINGQLHDMLDNGIMFFKNPGHTFLKEAIDKSVYNILNHRYGNHPLDITGPMMLNKLEHSSVNLFKCSKVDNKKVVCIDDRVWFKYVNGFSTLSNDKNNIMGTNSYEYMWFNKNLFRSVPQNTKVSIIIPTYNYEKYVCDAVDSALNQTYHNFEVIVVDDGSTDNTKNIIQEKYKDKITYIYQDNSGVSVARNNGISKSTGNWILTLDADDWIHPDYIKDALWEIDNNNHKTLVTSRAYFTNSNLELNGKTYPEGIIDLNKTKLQNIIKENYVVTTSLFSKQMFNVVGGYDENITRAEDWELWINLIKHGVKVKYLENKRYFKYREHGSGKSVKLKNKLLETKAYIKRKHNTQKISDISFLYLQLLKRDCDYEGLIHYLYSDLNKNQISSILQKSEEFYKRNPRAI